MKEAGRAGLPARFSKMQMVEKMKELFCSQITSFEIVTLYTRGMRHMDECEIVMKDGQAEVSRYDIRYEDGEDRRVLGQRAVCSAEQVLDLLNRCGMLSWDSFDGQHPKDVMDGTMFRLEAVVNGGRKISARGSENFPRHYRDFTAGLYEILRQQPASQPENA